MCHVRGRKEGRKEGRGKEVRSGEKKGREWEIGIKGRKKRKGKKG